ncbi:MAG TPA: DUF4932 domain-containing protein [Mucilaginibacter sp.]|jgi:hypothetical protein|nr:DUF4932 domain-containing protein [Mucilaginibacter sp.]
MKRTFLTLLISLSFFNLFAQSKAAAGISGPLVDDRVELLSIASRLAEYDEYSDDANKLYVQDIHTRFDKYKDHPLVKYLRMVRDTNSIGFDAVATMSIHVGHAPGFKPLVTFTADVPDKRWGAGAALKCDSLMAQFYQDTHFAEFFKAHQTMYDTAVSRFNLVYRQLDLSWYPAYYGIPPRGSFNIVLGFGNGGANYGPKVVYPDGHEESYAIMGCWKFDNDGKPSFDDVDYLPTLIHEFNHSYVNYLIEQHRRQFQSAGEKIYAAVGPKMQRLAYANWKTMLDEALVRASVIRYMIDHQMSQDKIDHETQQQLYIGFVWIDKLVDLLGAYESDRKTYPTLDSFMPKLVEFYTSVAGNMNQILADYSKSMVHVTAIEPALSKDSTVSPGLTQIKVYFDKALVGKGMSINYGPAGKEHYPGIKSVSYTDDKKAILLQFMLKPKTTYEFVLTGLSFKTPDGHPLESYLVSFKTGE